ncbi:MAG: hypothetical protein IT445_05825 [Phycisphaeraceae bacterium]|nr:hypothetical protein [Phycisphaeraceae bacterium]
MITWSTSELADVVAEGLRRRAEQDDLEQAVYGFDALDELGLHPVVQEAFRVKGFGVWPEQRYPGHWSKKNKSQGDRCDMVLTPPPQALPLRDPELKGTLFAATEAVDADQAYWLEIKTVAQYETGGPFARYSAELLSPVARDVRKIWQDGVIRHGGLLLVLFTEHQQMAEHDLLAWHTRCLDRGYPVSPPAARGFAIGDRMGNRWCAAAIFGVRG